MKKVASVALLAMVLAVLIFTGCGPKIPDGALGSIETKTAPRLDGLVDKVWDDAPKFTIDVVVPEYPVFEASYYKNAYEVTVQSLHTDDDIYFLYQWTGDDELSDARQSWYYNETEGKWMQKPKKEADEYYPATYEDKLAVIWNINDSVEGFNEDGGSVLCHGEKKATNAEGETADIWHWKSDRTGPVHQIDDKWLAFSDGDGRTGDEGTGAYSSNSQDLTDASGATVKVPLYWVPGATDYHWIMADDANARQIVEIDAEGNLVDEDGTILAKELFDGDSAVQIPSLYGIKPATGSRGDVTAYHNYNASSHTWTLEVQRALDTGNADDVDFSDPEKEYYFSVAVFDGAAIAHAVPGGMSGNSFPLVMR